MPTMPKTKTINKKKYILWSKQYSPENAKLSAEIIKDRVPWSDPQIIKSKGTFREQHTYGIYVLNKGR